MKRINWMIGLFLLTMATVALTAAKATAAATLQEHDVPLSGEVVNPCNGENVTFTGVLHLVESVTLDAGGGFHMKFRDNIHVTGTGDLGNSYEGNEEDLDQLNGRVGVEQTISTTFSEISKGSAPNFEQHLLLHVTVNANGTVTSSVDKFTSSCRG